MLLLNEEASIPLVPTLPADASLYAGQVYLSPRWPLLASAPGTVVDKQRFRLAGRNVVELNGPDTLSLPVLSSDIRYVPWEIEWSCNDLASTQSATNRLLQVLCSTGAGTVALVYKTTQTNIVFEIRNSDGTSITSVSGNVPSSGFFRVKIKKNGTTSGTIQLYVNDVLQGTSLSVDYSVWNGANSVVAISMSDTSMDLRPYQVFGYKATYNGVLIDNIPCLEQSGITLANTVTPARVATLSDSTAHAFVSGLTDDAPYGTEYLGVGGSWVAQPSVTFGTWKSRPVISLNGPDAIRLPNFFVYISPTSRPKFEFCFADITAGVATLSVIFNVYNTSLAQRISVYVDATTGILKMQLRDSNGVIFGTIIGPSINCCDGYIHYTTIEFFESYASITVDGVTGSPLNLSGFVSDTYSNTLTFIDYREDIRPLNVISIKNSLNSVNTDSFPCDDGTGLTVRNTTTPSRPGTITDNSPSGVWVYSWVPTA